MSDRRIVFHLILCSIFFLSSQVVASTRFNLIDVATNRIVQSNIEPSQQVVLGGLSAFNFSVEITDLSYDRIRIYTSSGHSQTERYAPYALCSDVSGDFLDCASHSGFSEDFTLTAQAYSGGTPVGSPASISVLQEAPDAAAAEAYFGVIDSASDQVIASLSSGSQTVLANNANFNFNVRFLNLVYDRVRFSTNTGGGRQESAAPYAACGDNGGNYFSCSGVTGYTNNFILTAQAYFGNTPVGEAATLNVVRSSSGVVSGQSMFGLINADTNAQISSISGGGQMVVPENTAFNFNVQFAGITYDRVRFNASNGSSRQEGVAPYAACGDYSGDYLSCSGFSGAFTLTAQAYSGSTPASEPATISVVITDSLDDLDNGSLQAPVVTTLSGNQMVSEGSDVVLSISAAGSGIRYQWYKDGVGISGATGNQLSLYDVNSEDAGSYYCIASNAAGSTRSNSMSVNVLAVAPTASVAITWNPPTRRVDGSLLNVAEIDAYRIYYGLTSQSGYAQMVEVNGDNTQVILRDLPYGQYKFALSTMDNNRLESALSALSVLTVE